MLHPLTPQVLMNEVLKPFTRKYVLAFFFKTLSSQQSRGGTSEVGAATTKGIQTGG